MGADTAGSAPLLRVPHRRPVTAGDEDKRSSTLLGTRRGGCPALLPAPAGAGRTVVQVGRVATAGGGETMVELGMAGGTVEMVNELLGA